MANLLCRARPIEFATWGISPPFKKGMLETEVNGFNRKERTMRSIVISAIVISLIGFTPQIALAATYTLQQYPEGFVNVPCSAFKRTANGSWKEVAVFIYHGSKSTGNTYPPGSREAGFINQKCGAK
jgi:hypothetical protein